MSNAKDASGSRSVVFTIVSANYLAFAKGLMQSVRLHLPDAERFVILADEPEGVETPDPDLFAIVPARELGVPHYDHMALRYSILEFNTALKPLAFRWLAESHEHAAITYLDPDIVVMSPLGAVDAAIASGALAVLTPHIDGPLDDGKRPDEVTFLRVGAYNLGFLATGPHPSRMSLLDWWAARLEFGAYVDLEFGTFTDQKWMDLVPGLFPDVFVLRSPAYNLAYWNLPVRDLSTSKSGELLAGGEPVAFAHFSGVDLRHPEEFSKHQNRFTADSIGELRPVYDRYLETLAENGHDSLSKHPYAYERLRDGTTITSEMRALFRHVFDVGRPREVKDPFSLKSADFAAAVSTRVRMTRRALETYRMVRRRPLVRLVMDRLSARAVWTLRRRVLRAAMPPAVRDAHDVARRADIAYPTSRPTGLEDQPVANILGYFEGEFGVAEAGRQLARAAQSAGVELALVNIDAGPASRQRDQSMSAALTTEAPHPISIYCVNADQTELSLAVVGSRIASGRYNIGFWFWELARFPIAWRGAIEALDEIWVATNFVRDAVAAETSKPVITMGVAVDAEPSRTYTRGEFGVPERSFTFLFTFDFASYVARKNPTAVVSAFRRAFPKGDEPASLVLKSINGGRNPAGLARLRDEAAADRRIQLLDGFLSRDEVFGLESVADCFVSLHRSEGFGLGLAESMCLGKPVIATAYSGNMDFMSAANSCLVGYELVSVRAGDYPHADGQLWAEPDIEHAAYYMRRLAQDPRFAAKLGNTARRELSVNYSRRTIGTGVASRLRELRAASSR